MSIPSVLTEATSSRSRTAKSEKQKAIAPSKILETIEQHVLLDGFKVVVDLDKSRGSYLHNAVSGKRLIDLYGFFGSMPIGFNHPHFDDPAVQRDLLRAAKVKIANSDVYSQGYAEFVETFECVVGLPPPAAMFLRTFQSISMGRAHWQTRRDCRKNRRAGRQRFCYGSDDIFDVVPA
jgi:L-lysine 6-transaminase